MIRYLACLIVLSATTAHAQWENLNPGAGGRIQDIVLDENTPGRAFYMSDMEGVSRTDDHGQSWQYLGADLSHSNTLTVAVEPGNSDRVYLGTVQGIEISDNGGENWARVRGVNDPITQIAINPDNVNEIYAVTSDKMRWKISGWQKVDPLGKRILYVSRNRGKTWDAVEFEGGYGRRDTFTVTLDPTDSSNIYISGLAGVFRSTDSGKTWEQLPQPENTGDSWGASLSPDGKTLYAAFQVPKASGKLRRSTGAGSPARWPTHLFATRTDKIDWHDLSDNAKGFRSGDTQMYWMPEVNHRSKPNQHQVLTASIGDRQGLYEVTVDWKGNRPTAVWNRVFHYENDGVGAEFDTGWERYSTRPLAWQYKPESWGKPGIWTTGDQTLYWAHITGRDWTQDWNNVYTQYVKTIDGERFYRTRGVQCTFVFDADGYRDWVVQANGDNAIKESYDNGQSWHVGIIKPRSNSVTLIRDLDPPLVLAHISPGYGGSSTQGSLYAKRMKHFSPRDPWQQVAGGPREIGGLPNTLYEQIVVDPFNPTRVFIGTIDRGVFVIDDIEAFVENPAKHPARQIAGDDLADSPDRVRDKGQGMIADPNRPGRLWVSDNNVIWVGDENGSQWTWRVVNENSTQIAAWDMNGKTIVASIKPGDHDDAVEVSIDEGETWTTAVTFDDARPLRKNPWYRKNAYPFTVAGLVGHDDRMYLAFTHWTTSKSYGMFEATLDDSGKVTELRDITGDFGFPYPVKSRIVMDGDRADLYVATKGMGLWRLKGPADQTFE